ncbi:G-type lectin S-receptor-like serine/threonine-protein kinase At1g11330 [Aristolochia californica]|uniref:G-type lectin S-receptor-like serine/threonine-protein kinase At1g11330 n=1 Tax=Aristolochia californica TaxID=171875 RepID=UPI0035DC9937
MATLIRGGVCMRALIAYCLFSVFCLSPCKARDAITLNRGLKDGETIASGGGKFVLGFFSPGRSSNRYVGIWYGYEPEQPVLVVWVANRENPLTDSSGVISINENGNLVITDGRENLLWWTATSTAVRTSSARLLDTGNLVLLDVNTGETIWQSFDYLCHAFVPKMKLGIKSNTNQSRFLQSWKDTSDPSVGKFSLAISTLKPYQVLIWSNSEPYWRSGPWNGRVFLGVLGMGSVYHDGFSITTEGGSVDLVYDVFSDSESNTTLFMLNSSGILEQQEWLDESKKWSIYWTAPASECDLYGNCGPNGVCNPLSSPLCTCIKGFEPRFWEEWNKGNWSGGCVRRHPLSCDANGSSAAGKKEEGFLKLQNMKPPDSIASLSFDNEEGCEGVCLRNCSCSAYAFDAGIGCMFWSGELIDLQIFPVEGVNLYLRLPASELGQFHFFHVIFFPPLFFYELKMAGMFAFATYF